MYPWMTRKMVIRSINTGKTERMFGLLLCSLKDKKVGREYGIMGLSLNILSGSSGKVEWSI